MSAYRYALEIGGAGIAVVMPRVPAVESAGRAEPADAPHFEPAWAAFESGTIATGRAAVARARLAPLFVSSRHLEEPSTAPLPRPGPAARSSADLVYAQLAAIEASERLAGAPVLLAVSSAYSLEELQLLLGIAAAARLEVAGVVDAAVAATAALPSLARALYLDLEMQRALLVELVRGADLRRGRVDVSHAVGLRAYEDAFAQLIARALVAATRFDPLHQAPTEQLLYDRLAGWVAAAADGAAPVVIEYGGLRHEARLSAAQLEAAAAPLTAELVRLVHSARRAGEAVTLYLTARVAGLPGLAAALAQLRDCEIVPLPPGAAGAGALTQAPAIAAGELALVSRLEAGASLLRAAAPRAAQERGAAPTHVVYQGRAQALTAAPLLVGREPGAPRALIVGGAIAGISRSHCSLVARGGETVLEDHSRHGTFLNGERVQRRARLAAGDRIRLGTPGVELELVRIE